MTSSFTFSKLLLCFTFFSNILWEMHTLVLQSLFPILSQPFFAFTYGIYALLNKRYFLTLYAWFSALYYYFSYLTLQWVRVAPVSLLLASWRIKIWSENATVFQQKQTICLYIIIKYVIEPSSWSFSFNRWKCICTCNIKMRQDHLLNYLILKLKWSCAQLISLCNKLMMS